MTPALSLQNDSVVPYLKSLATPQQQARWLLGYISGEIIGAIAMSEPGAGSDLAGIRTPARRDGADWILNGSKTFISAGFNSDLVIMVARRHGRSGLMLRLLQHPTTTQLRSVTVADRVREDRCHPTGGSSRKSLNNFRAKPSDQVGDAVADAGGDPVTDLLFGFAVALTEAVVDAGERGFGVAQGALAGPPDPAISSPRPTRAGANSGPAGAAELAIVVRLGPPRAVSSAPRDGNVLEGLTWTGGAATRGRVRQPTPGVFSPSAARHAED